MSKRFPPRFKPYYVWGVGWFDDTRYVEKIKFGCASILMWLVIIWLFLVVLTGAINVLGEIVSAVVG